MLDFHRNNEDPRRQKKTLKQFFNCKSISKLTRISNCLFDRTARIHFEAASASPPIIIGEPNSWKCSEIVFIWLTSSEPFETCIILQSTLHTKINKQTARLSTRNNVFSNYIIELTEYHCCFARAYPLTRSNERWRFIFEFNEYFLYFSDWWNVWWRIFLFDIDYPRTNTL